MRSRQEFMNEYQRSHLHPLNQWIHIFCVPLIFVSSAGLMWSVSLARFFPQAGPALAPWLNLAVLVSLPILFFYARLGLSSFVSGLAWTLARHLYPGEQPLPAKGAIVLAGTAAGIVFAVACSLTVALIVVVGMLR